MKLNNQLNNYAHTNSPKNKVSFATVDDFKRGLIRGCRAYQDYSKGKLDPNERVANCPDSLLGFHTGWNAAEKRAAGREDFNKISAKIER